MKRKGNKHTYLHRERDTEISTLSSFTFDFPSGVHHHHYYSIENLRQRKSNNNNNNNTNKRERLTSLLNVCKYLIIFKHHQKKRIKIANNDY